MLPFSKAHVVGVGVGVAVVAIVFVVVCYSHVVASFVGALQLLVDTLLLLVQVEKLCQYKKLHSHHQYNYYFQLLL